MAKWALAALGFARTMLRRIPEPTLKEYITPERLKKWMREKYPDLWKVFEEEGEKAETWLKNEVEKDLIPWIFGRRLERTSPS